MLRGRTHVVRTGPIGWSYAGGLALIGLAVAWGVVEAGEHAGYLMIALGFTLWALARALIGGVWIDQDGNLLVRDWIRTRKHLAADGLVVAYLPYDGPIIASSPESRVWAMLTFASSGGRPRPCRITVARFSTIKDRVKTLRSNLGLPAGPGRLE